MYSIIRLLTLFLSSILFIAGLTLHGQTPDIKLTKTIEHSPVKNQYRSNTCWAFTGVSLLESELIRQGKGIQDLSEMHIIKYAFLTKAEKYVRLHGNMNFSGAGEMNDVLDVMQQYGLIPESVFIAKQEHMTYMHGEMDEVLKAFVDAIVKNKNERLSNVWNEGFNMLLNVYLGSAPATFSLDSIAYTPESYSEKLGLKKEDYVMITSFMHHPFHEPFILEVPDNWSHGVYYNVEIDELKEITNYALDNGYSLAWAGDISEPEYSWEQGIASTKKTGITQKDRQIAFDNYETTDDHALHIVGKGKGKNGENFFYAKNSWGSNNVTKGYCYLSEDYFSYKTVSILLNKNGIPPAIREKLKLQ